MSFLFHGRAHLETLAVEQVRLCIGRQKSSRRDDISIAQGGKTPASTALDRASLLERHRVVNSEAGRVGGATDAWLRPSRKLSKEMVT